MKKIFFLLFAFIFIKTNAQTADEIIQKYTNAMGGLDNFKKIKTAKLTGTVTTQGNDLPITVQIINGRAMRTDVEVMGQTITNVYKDEKGWKINPYAGDPTATDVIGDELKEFGNIKISMSRSVQSGGQTLQEVHFDKVELDVPIDEKIFDKQ